MYLSPPIRKNVAVVAFVTLLLSLLSFNAQPAFAAPSGTLTINDSGSDSLPAPSDGVYEIQSNITVKPADIEAAIASGAVTLWATSITVESDIDVPNANALTLKATGNIEVNGNVETAGGDIILWADSDASGTAQSAGGHIALFSGHSLNTGAGGGDIVLAGGNDDNSDGIPDGYAFGTYTVSEGVRGTSAVFLGSDSTLTAGAGMVLIRGHGTDVEASGLYRHGVRLQEATLTASEIDIFGRGAIVDGHESSSNWGVAVMGSELTASGDISISGWGGAGDGGALASNANNIGVRIDSAQRTGQSDTSLVESTGSGSITITGVGTATDTSNIYNPHGIWVRDTASLETSTGDIVLHGTTGYTSSVSETLPASTTFAVVLGPNLSTNGNVHITGVAGPEGTGGGLSLKGVSATSGRVTLSSPVAFTQAAATVFSASELALAGAGSFTLTNTGNGFGTVAGGSADAKLGSVSIYDQSGGLTVGAVGALEGISATGDILIETGSGDITLARSLTTASTSSSAITVNAGKTTAAGTASGGNIVVSGTPTVSAGAGSIVKLFSGSESASTGLTSLVGGLSKVYYGVDEGSSLSPSPSGGAQYALYRSSISIPRLSSLSNISSIVGNSSTLTSPTATNQSNNAVPGSVSWSTSNSSVASISGTTLTYGSTGTATITATFTPTDTTNYSVATITFTVTIAAAGGGGGSSSSSSSSAVTSPPVAPATAPRQTRLTIVGPNTNPVPRPVERLGLRFDPDAPSRATVGGMPANLVKTPAGSDGLSLTAGAFQFGVSLADADGAEVQTETPSQSPELFVPRGQSAAVSGKGSYPGSFVQLFLPGNGNDSRELARIPVRSDGTFASDLSFEAGALELPVPIGRQVLQVVGYDERGNQTVVDMTVNIGQGVPAPEPNRQAGALPALTAGQSLATSGGIPETVSVTGAPETGNVVVEGSGWVISVNADRENGVVENADGNVLVRLNPSSVGTTFGNGFLPGTLATVWLFSEPTLMATVTVDDNGEFSAEFLVDARLIAPGEHTLQVQGVGSDGYIKAANLGVLVEQPVEVTAESASGLLWWVLGFFPLAVVFFFFLLARRRRRQDA